MYRHEREREKCSSAVAVSIEHMNLMTNLMARA